MDWISFKPDGVKNVYIHRKLLTLLMQAIDKYGIYHDKITYNKVTNKISEL